MAESGERLSSSRSQPQHYLANHDPHPRGSQEIPIAEGGLTEALGLLSPVGPDFEPCPTHEAIRNSPPSSKKKKSKKKKDKKVDGGAKTKKKRKRKKSSAKMSTLEIREYNHYPAPAEVTTDDEDYELYQQQQQSLLGRQDDVDDGDSPTVLESPVKEEPSPAAADDNSLSKKSSNKKKKKKKKAQDAGETTDEDFGSAYRGNNNNNNKTKKKKSKKKKAEAIVAEGEEAVFAGEDESVKRKKKKKRSTAPEPSSSAAAEPTEEEQQQQQQSSALIPAKPITRMAPALVPGAQFVREEEPDRHNLQLRVKDPRRRHLSNRSVKSGRSVESGSSSTGGKQRISRMNLSMLESSDDDGRSSVNTGESSSTVLHDNLPRQLSREFFDNDERWERKMGLDGGSGRSGGGHNNHYHHNDDPIREDSEEYKTMDKSSHHTRSGHSRSDHYRSQYDPEYTGQPVSTAAYGRAMPPDLEYGVTDQSWMGYKYGGADDDNLAVAVMVTEEEDQPDVSLYHHAVEYDPDAKPPLHQNRRFRLYLCFGFVLLSLLGASVAAVVVLTTVSGASETLAPTGAPSAAPSTSREGLYLAQLQALVGPNVNAVGTPEHRAVRWLLEEDTMQLDLLAVNLFQRYLAALAYFETTDNGNRRWRSCNPPRGPDEDANCDFQRFVRNSDDQEAYEVEPGIRWLSGEHECTWVGVLCDDAATIRSIEIWGQNITGPLPTRLANFPFLQSVSVAYNEFTGTLPEAYSQMRHLLRLEVQGNQLSGSIPSSYWRARSLQSMNLQENRLNGTISTEIGIMTDLKGLHIGRNQFQGTIPTEMGLLTSLAFWRANINQLSGTLPTELGQLTLLEEFWMYQNSFTGTIPSEIGSMTSLVDVRLYRNRIRGTIPEELYFNKLSLRHLLLDDMELTGTLSRNVQQLVRLETLRVARNQLQGFIPTELDTLASLRVLWLQFNNFVGAVPQSICQNVGPSRLAFLNADCGPANNPDQPCDCCHSCCDRATQICRLTELADSST